MMNEELGGYFQTGRENDFPWDRTDKGVWYCIISDKRISGFTSSKSNKKVLSALIRFLIGEHEQFRVIGVWNGTYSTSLFLLDPIIASKKLMETVT